MAARKRRHRTPQGQVEDEILKNQRWSGLREQNRLIALNHSKAENDAARERAMAFVESGWGAVDWSEVVGCARGQ